MIIATILYSAGIALFLDPNDLVSGGVTGLAIILNRIIQIKTGTLILALNIPLLILGFVKFGYRFVANTGITVIMVTILTNYMNRIGGIIDDPMLAAVIGSVLTGCGMALLFKQDTTTGGMDIVVKILRLKYPHLKTGSLFFLTDAIVIMIAGIFFGTYESAMYGAIAMFVNAKAMNYILYGSDEASLFYIISDHNEEIAKIILEELDIGITFLDGAGAYSGKEKKVILCATQKKVAPKVLEVVKEIDQNAFMLACSANEIYGEGYKSYDSMPV